MTLFVFIVFKVNIKESIAHLVFFIFLVASINGHYKLQCCFSDLPDSFMNTHTISIFISMLSCFVNHLMEMSSLMMIDDNGKNAKCH